MRSLRKLVKTGLNTAALLVLLFLLGSVSHAIPDCDSCNEDMACAASCQEPDGGITTCEEYTGGDCRDTSCTALCNSSSECNQSCHLPDGSNSTCGEAATCQVCSSVCSTSPCDTSCWDDDENNYGPTTCEEANYTCGGCTEHCSDSSDCRAPCYDIGSQEESSCGTYGRCEDPFLEGKTVSSCENYCGRRWVLYRELENDHNGGDEFADYEDGCSCEASCGYEGNCCPDVNEFCPGTALDNSLDSDLDKLDGQQFLQVAPAAEPVSILTRNATRTGDYTGRKAIMTVDSFAGDSQDGDSVAGITGIQVSTVEAADKHTQCRVFPGTPVRSDVPYWFVQTRNEAEGMLSECEGMGLRYPADSDLSVSDESPLLHAGEHNGYDAEHHTFTGKTPSNSFPLLTHIRTERLFQTGGCLIDESSDNWRLTAFANDSSGNVETWCQARVLNFPSAGPVQRATGPFTPRVENLLNGDPAPTSHGHSWSYEDDSGTFFARSEAVYDASGRPRVAKRTTRVEMYSQANHACFLKTVQVETARSDKSICKISQSDGSWWLEASQENATAADCRAHCLQTHDANADDATAWPPVPSEIVEDSSGARFELFQSGNYDKPFVFFEGFDPIQTHSSPSVLRSSAPLVRTLLSWGYDVWFVDLADGGQPVVETMRQNALAIETAFKRQPVESREDVVAFGVSMGGLAGRAMLATWEDGTYNCTPAAGTECIAPDLGRGTGHDPPVSLFISLNGPHNGAQIPLAIQAVTQDIGLHYDIGEPKAAINSPAAINLLRHRLNNQSCKNQAMEHCGNAWTFHDGTRVFEGNVVNGHVCNLDIQGCTDINHSNVCHGTKELVGDVFFDGGTSYYGVEFDGVNTRGSNGNGYPSSVFTVGASNAAWDGYDCDSMQGSYNCDEQHDQLDIHSTIKFVDDGHTILGFCPRDSFYELRFRSDALVDERRPADVTGRRISSIGIGNLPHQVSALDFKQWVPYPFVPTDSALHCPGASSEEECQQMNELNQRFDRVLSTPEGLNGAHASMSPGLAAQVLALLWDAYQADGDGYCGEDNPYGACGGGVDCDDSDPTKNPAGASCGGGGSCFAAGTPILMADGSPKAIESISVGDAVMSYDIAQDKIVFGVVTAAIAHKNETETMVVINGSLQATTDHPIYINGSWADAGTLKVGDTLSIRNPASAEVEAVPVHSVERLERRATVYDLEVAGVQNYFAAGILVHNKDLPVNHFSAMGGGTP